MKSQIIKLIFFYFLIILINSCSPKLIPPRIEGRNDLTTKAAKQLNFIKSGLTKVEIIVLDSLKK